MSGQEGRAPFTVQFDALRTGGSQPPDAVYRWEFGDGQTAEGQNVSHTYTQAGAFTAKLYVHNAGREEPSAQSPVTQIIVRPGALASVLVDPGEQTVFTGDSALLSASAFDEFGNLLRLEDITWEAAAGQVAGDRTGGTFTAGRETGEVTVAATAHDGQRTVTGEATVRVEPGYCVTETRRAEWAVEWFPRAGTQALATTTEPGKMRLDATPSSVSDSRRITASTEIVVQRQGPVRFVLAAQGQARLQVNGKDVIEDQTGGEEFVVLEPGVHRLDLEYAWNDVPQLTFEADGDVLEWEAATQCHGRYVAHSESWYMLLETSANAAQTADRFGVAPHELVAAGGQGVLVPGTSGAEAKVIFVHGLGSSAGCATGDAAFSRGLTLLHAIQTKAWENTGGFGSVTAEDVITFSYSGSYTDCESGATAEANAPAPGLRASYASADTCEGVEAASERLGALVEALHDESPGAQVYLIGHSLGGMVAAHYLATGAGSPEDGLVEGVITLDSPLKGYDWLDVGLPCSPSSPSRNDLRGTTPVVGAIASLGQSSWADRLLAINSIVGQTVGPRAIEVRCSSDLSDADSLLTALLGLAAFFTIEHNCGFSHPDSLGAIAEMVNGRAAGRG